MKMENRKLKMIWALMALLLPTSVLAQGVDMAETMRSEGKIYVVVGVIAIIFIGLVVYLISLDRRISKMENRK
jgi:CcmD family protein